MNNRIRRFIAVTVVAMLAFCMLVSCDNNVITTKNKDYAYTEILETNGVFEYNGQYYDSLSGAIKAIEESGEEGTIKLTGNVFSRPVEIPAGVSVTIDLCGKEMRLYGVKDSGITVGEGSEFYFRNGTVSVAESNKDLKVISTEGAKHLNLLNLTVEAEGQIALYLDGLHSSLLEESVAVKGAIIATGGKENTHLEIENELSDVRMNGATLVVEGIGKAIVTENDGSNAYAQSPDGDIIDLTMTIDPAEVEKGVWYIERSTNFHIFGSLKDAINHLETGDSEIILIDNEETNEEGEIALNQSVKLNLQNGYSTGVHNITLGSGVELEIVGPGTFIGTITSEGEENSELTVTGVAFNCSVEVDGDVSLTNVGGSTELPITSTNGSITIDNSAAGTNFGAGAITAKDAVVLKGYYDPFGVGEVKAASLTATSITGIGNVDVSGDLVSAGSSFVGTVKASTVTDGSSTTIGSIFKGSITASGDINLTCSTFNSGTETAPSVTSANGDINLTKVSGTAGAITADGEDGSGNVSIDNTSAEVVLTTGALITENGDISVNGYSSTKPVTVNGNVSASNALTSSNAVFNGTVSATSITDGSSTTAGSTFKGNVTASGDVNLTGSTFNSGTTTAPTVTSTGGDISMTNAYGTAGAITAEGTDGDVTIDNSNSTITEPFKTGAVTAKDKVDIKGKEGNLTVDISGNVYANEISIENSHIIATDVAKEKTGTVYTPASSVTIKNPINASGPSSSYIGNLYADELTVSATSVGITLEVGNAVVSGGSSTESTVSGGFYDHLNHSGDGKLTINSGNFYDFAHNGGSATNTLKGGYFYVVGTNSDNGFSEINNLINMVGSNGNITITSDPQTQKYGGEAALVALPTSASFHAVPNSGNVNLRFYSFKNTQTGVLKGGWVVDTNTTTAKTTAFTFGNGITVSGSVYLCLGDTITSNLSLIDEDSGMQVFKLKSDNTTSSSISIAMVPGTYTYKADVDVVFHSNTDTDTTVSKSFEYNTAVTLPTADSMNIKKEYYEVDYWTATAQSTTPVYNDGAEVTLTADTELYAHWKESGVTVYFTAGSYFSPNKTSELYRIGYAFGAEEQGTAKGLATGTVDTSIFEHIFIGWYIKNTSTLVTNDTVVTADYRDKKLVPKTALLRSTNFATIILSYGALYDSNANSIGGALSSSVYYTARTAGGIYAVDDSDCKYVSIKESDNNANLTFLTEEQINKISAAVVALSKITGTTAYKAYNANRYFIVSGDSGSWSDTAPASYKNLDATLAYGFGILGNVTSHCEEIINSI